MNNDYRPPACLVSFHVTRNTFTINIGLIVKVHNIIFCALYMLYYIQGFEPQTTSLSANGVLWPLWKARVHLGDTQKVDLLTRTVYV